MPYLRILGLEFLKNYGHIWNQHPQVCLSGKFCDKKTKMSKFENKNVLFLSKNLKKLLSYESVPSNLSNFKILQKETIMPKFAIKNALFGYFWARI